MGYHQLPITAYNPPDPMEGIQKGLQLKSMLQGQQLQQQGIQENALKLQQVKQGMQDEQMFRAALAQLPPGATIGDALPVLRGKVSAKTYLQLQEADRKVQDDLRKRTTEDLAAMDAQHKAILPIYSAAMQMPDDQYAANFPQIAAQYNAIPGIAQKLNPNQPISKQQLSQFGPMLALQDAYTRGEMAKRESAAKLTVGETEAANMQKYGTKEQRKPVPGVDVPFSPEVQAQKIDIAQKSRPINNNVFSRDDAKVIADEIQNGDQPPTLSGLYRNTGAVKAELARRQVPLAKMEMDWKATQKHILTLNGPQQLRMKQSIESAEGMLDKIEGLYGEWKQVAGASGFKVINKATLATMKQMPGRAGAVAQALDTQIADLTADLGNVYMGGNTPTDQALKLASKNLAADWNDQQFTEGLKQARMNVRIRGNSIRHSLPSGVSENTLYPMPNQEAPKKDSLGIR